MIFTKIKKHPIISFTILFLLVFRFFNLLLIYFVDKQGYFKQYYGIDIWVFLLIIPIIYLLQLLIVIWVAEKLPKEKLINKFYEHPVASIVLLILYLTDLPYRLSGFNLGAGLWLIINAFEVIVYYAFLSFLWWLLICWISKKIWKQPKEREWQWYKWYKSIVNKAFQILPPFYKFILGIIVAIFIFNLLILFISLIFGYSGADFKKLMNY